MPLTSKGEEIKSNMTKEYGAKKGEQVFYASKNAGRITGVDESMVTAPSAGVMPSAPVRRKATDGAIGGAGAKGSQGQRSTTPSWTGRVV